jgi:hypothetical protein
MFGLTGAVAFAFFGAVAAIAWAAAYAWGEWLAHRHDTPPRPHKLPVEDTARLERLETGLEALTLEVERLAEGQRYTARLLDERLPRGLPGAVRAPTAEPGRVVTPH